MKDKNMLYRNNYITKHGNEATSKTNIPSPHLPHIPHKQFPCDNKPWNSAPSMNSLAPNGSTFPKKCYKACSNQVKYKMLKENN